MLTSTRKICVKSKNRTQHAIFACWVFFVCGCKYLPFFPVYMGEEAVNHSQTSPQNLCAEGAKSAQSHLHPDRKERTMKDVKNKMALPMFNRRTCLKSLLTLPLAPLFAGCTASVQSLNDTITRNDISPIELTSEHSDVATDFTQCGLDFLALLPQGENLLLSPLSILAGLAMVANGTGGETLAQMEALLGSDIATLNNYLYAYRLALPQSDTDADADEQYQATLASSIWFNEAQTLAVQESFLQTNADYYDAQVYSAAFDENLPAQVNDWVSDATDGMIDNILGDAPMQDMQLCLVNALSFTASWRNVYEDSNVKTQTFTNYDGSTSETELMHSTESAYLTLKNATGLRKDYADGAYAFVALLPEEGVDVYDFVANLNAEDLRDALENATATTVNASIPKFTVEYSEDMQEALRSLGVVDAFDPALADFSPMATSTNGLLYLDEVLHKSKITVDTEGTQAAAATAYIMRDAGSAFLSDFKEVHLTRPFFYMIVDKAQNLPLFVGVYADAS